MVVVVSVRVIEPYGKGEGVFTNLKEEKLGYVIVDIEIEIESQTSLPTALVKVAQSMLKFLLNNDAFDPLHSQMTAYNIEAIL